jgi:ABC-type multidrug transport system fused ATPase/permease subunit
MMRQQALDVVNNRLQENLSGVRVVKAFVREKYETARFGQVSDDLKEAALAPAYRIAIFLPTAQSLIYISVVVVYLVMGREVMLTQTLALGDVVVFSQLASRRARAHHDAGLHPSLHRGGRSVVRAHHRSAKRHARSQINPTRNGLTRRTIRGR